MAAETVAEPEVVESTATEVGSNGTELVPQQRAAATLFRTDDPAEVIERARKAADALKRVLVEQQMVKQFGDREHVQVEGWQTLGGMMGVVAAEGWVSEIPWPENDHLSDQLRAIRDKGYVFGYQAGFTARTLDGRVVGTGEHECKRTESAWCLRRGKIVDDYALKGMAQTRATSRCLQGPLRFIVTLAGYSGTPAEEMPPEGEQASASAPPKAAPRTTAQEPQRSEQPLTAQQKGAINARMGEAGLTAAEASAVRTWFCARVECTHFDRLPKSQASRLIRALKQDGSGARVILDDLATQADAGHEVAKQIVTRMEEG